MTGARRPGGVAVHWLTAQAVMFGAMAALLGVVANAMFLEAYGSGWLPVTYILIGAAGIAVSGAIAGSARRFDLLGIALVVLGGAAVGLAASWVIAVGADGAWVSVPLLVLFPILIQLGFVFIGGQAGRILDIAGIKAFFPRIMTGFPVGAVIGGVLAGQLVTWLGRTEHLLLATAIAQGGFAALVWATGRRYATQLAPQGSGRPPHAGATTEEDRRPDSSMRHLFASRFVVLILAYQVLSALGSQLSDFLVFDRATAQYPASADLARFLAGYTAVMNVVSIAFLFLVAGPLLRRFGLRLGISANPVVLTVFAVGMAAVLAATGGMSMALLLTVSAARIADIALTDGTTRTSINALYQVLPERARLSVQTTVEGIGVPVAIGISGVVILVLNALPFALAATIAVTAIVCAAWTWIGVLLYRAYGPALVQALRRRPLLVPTALLDATPEDEAAARRLLSSPDARTALLGFELLAAMSSPALAGELGTLADDPRPDVRMSALAGLASSGDERARRQLAEEVRACVSSPDPALRLRAARALEALGPADREAAAALLVDDDTAVRCAALDSVQAGDRFAVPPVLAALADARTHGAAAGAVERLADAIVPSMAERLEAAGSPAHAPVVRLVRAAATRSPDRDEVLVRHVEHRDRELGLAIMERLAAPEPATEAAATVLDGVLRADARHATRILAALTALDGGDPRDGDAPVRRALEDELDLVRRRVAAGLVARHGSGQVGPAMVELAAGGPGGALAVETLEVHLASDSRVLIPLLQPALPAAERLVRMPALAADDPADVTGWLRDLVEDPAGAWRSPWLRACAIHAAEARGVLPLIDVAAAGALGDPVIDEELARQAVGDLPFGQ